MHTDGPAVNRAIGARVAWYMKYVSEPRRTQAELAELLGIEQSAVSKKLTGRRPFFPHELYSIAEWLDRPLSDFLAPSAEAFSSPPDNGPGSGRNTHGYRQLPAVPYSGDPRTGRDTAEPVVTGRGRPVGERLQALGGQLLQGLRPCPEAA